MQQNILRYIECLILFFVLPCLLYFVRYQMAFRVFYLLFLMASAGAIILLRDSSFDRRILWQGVQLGHLRSIVVIFLPVAIFLSIVTYAVLPDKFLAFPASRPLVWLIIMLLYPILLALPQELLFRCSFFQRYRGLFKDKPARLIVLNALSFGLAHLFYGNWVAPVLSFFGGMLFAWRYHVSQSLFTVGLEHALWGNFLFTIGIGWYFYSGAIA